MALYDIENKNMNIKHIDATSRYFICTDYGITTENEDNTEAMQSLIDEIYNLGGGTIYIPIGVYKFSCTSAKVASGSITRLLTPKTGVSIIGENNAKSILYVYGISNSGVCLFGQNESLDGVISKCSFSSFTVDMSECVVSNYSWRGKAFYMHGVTECIFRDLQLIGTPATSLGIDCLKNVIIDSVYVKSGGRLWSKGGYGGAGIGIGTGLWVNENYIIRNCICDDCGNFGIFIENQANHTTPDFQGQIIANNIVLNGRGCGIGARTTKNVLVTGNNVYNCIVGLYVDDASDKVTFSGNHVSECDIGFEYGDGIVTGNGSGLACTQIAVVGNTFVENEIAIKKTVVPTESVEQYNVLIGNTSDAV